MKTGLFCLLACMFTILCSAQNSSGIVEGNGKFALNLYHEVSGGAGGNIFFSPFSISTALAMTYAGARGETALQMSSTLNFGQDDVFHSWYRELIDGIKLGTGDKIQLNIANGLWVQQDYKFLDTYFDLVKTNYHSELKYADFSKDKEREFARTEINGWVEQQTKNKIKNLVSPPDLDASTKMVLVNAIYFFGEWAESFPRDNTMPQPFFLAGKTQVTTSFMNRKGSYSYFEDKDVKAIEIPYKDNKASMVIFLPVQKNGIAELEKTLDYKTCMFILGSLKNNTVNLAIPKFTASYRVYLQNILSKMGMPLAFSGMADFSGMTGQRDLKISSVIHQAFINVDEKGTEAAAATAVVIKMMAAPGPQDIKIFKADHPFIFLIRDNTTGSILFMGKIMNPKTS